MKPAPAPVALLPWLTDTLAAMAATASRLQIDLQVTHRSFLPSHVVLDAALAARALQSVDDGLDRPLDVALANESALFGSLGKTTDMREGTAAFLEKRPASFRGA